MVAVEVEEPEAVAAAGGLQLVRGRHQRDALAAQLLGQGVDVGGRGRAEGDEVDALLGVGAQPHLVLLGRALGGEERDAGVGGLGRELPEVAVEGELAVEVGHAEVDVPEVGDQAVHLESLQGRAKRRGSAQGRCESSAEVRAMRPGTSAVPPAWGGGSWASSQCASCTEFPTTAPARGCRRAP